MILGKSGSSNATISSRVLDGFLVMKEDRPKGDFICYDNGDGTGSWFVSNEPEYNWAKSEIERSIIQLSKCELAEAYPLDEMATCTGTSEEWKQYIIKLRYYATYNETDGYSLRLDERPAY